MLRKWKALEEYWVANCEVTRGQFEEFINDAKVAVSDKSANWGGIDNRFSPTMDQPAQNVNWFDAQKYCSWLSQKEGRSPSYRQTGTKVKLYDSDNAASEAGATPWVSGWP